MPRRRGQEGKPAAGAACAAVDSPDRGQERAAASRRAEKARLLAQVEELGREKEEHQRRLQAIRQQADRWRQRREAVKQRLRELDKAADVARPSPGSSSSGTPAAKEEAETPRRCGSYLPPAEVELMMGDEDCAFCLDPLAGRAQAIALCGHIFHHSCLAAAAKRPGGETCPKCRGPVDQPTPEQMRSTVSLVCAISRELPAAIANVREATLEQLHARTAAAATATGARAVSRWELLEALGELSKERPDNVSFVDRHTVAFTW